MRQFDRPLYVSYGGGTNSTAVLVRMVKEKLRPDAIVFADTKGEKPHTYEYVNMLSTWLKAQGFPEIITVRNRKGLYEDCIERKTLPAIAFGFKTCSQRWKIRPQDNWTKVWPEACEAWETGRQVTKVIGIDADEPERANQPSDPDERKRYVNVFPLVDLDIGREECEREILSAGLPLPGKSACYFCPQSSPSEVLELKAQYPDLMERALAMEDAALINLKRRKTLKGLGMKYAWRDLVDGKITLEEAERLAGRKRSMPCGCNDNGAES